MPDILSQILAAAPQLKPALDAVPARLSVEHLENRASEGIGETDFGPAFYREGLERLLASANDEANLNVLGRLLIMNSARGYLENRLLMQRLRRTHAPELQTPLLAPLIVTGLPRTGSTFLHRLLASDPSHAGIPMWQLTHPIPRNAEDTPAQRLARVDELLALRRKLTPELDGTHLIRADAPEECMHIVGPSFQTRTLWNLAPVYSYQDWLSQVDKTDKYVEYVDYLRVVQATRPNQRLVLKAPDHVDGITELLNVLPEAMVVQTHRDMPEQFGSYMSLGRTTRKIAVNALDTAREVETTLKMADVSIARSTAAHAAHPGKIFDVKYTDLIADPLATARRVYAHFGLDMTEETVAGLSSYQKRNPKGKHGAHDYSLEDVGLSADIITERYKSYSAAFL